MSEIRTRAKARDYKARLPFSHSRHKVMRNALALQPQIAIECAMLHDFREVFGLEILDSIEVRNRSRNFENPNNSLRRLEKDHRNMSCFFDELPLKNKCF